MMPRSADERLSYHTTQRTTLRARMTLAVTLLCLGILTLAGTTTYVGAQAALQHNLDDALLSIARAEVASAIDEPNGKVHVHDEPISALHLPSGSGYEKFAQIENPADQIIARTNNLGRELLQGEAVPEAKARAGITSFGDLTHGVDVLRAVYYPLKDARGNPLITICAISTRDMQQSLLSLRSTLLSILTVSGLLAAFGANRLARRLTLPLERIAEEARVVDEISLNARLSVDNQDAEIHDLATILNAMLDRLEGAFAAQRNLMESQRRFLADASHELRSPLANLRGTIEVALRRPRDTAEYRETLEASMIEIERLSRLVNDLLTLSRADAGQFSVQLEPCDLGLITRRAVDSHRARAEQSKMDLSLIGNEPLPVMGDPHRLRQILDNLLDNALRYAPAESAIIIVLQRDEDNACVTVSDQGKGLTAEEQDRVFDRFYRTDESRARGTGGLGLGLAIARAFADAHHGRLTVTSMPEAGAAFVLALPLLKVLEATPIILGDQGDWD